MNPLRQRKWLLLTLVLGGFVFSVTTVTRRTMRDVSTERITLRFSHWQLEPGVRDAFDALAREYERIHPEVRVEQLLIPERIYTQWSVTQLVGQSAPDLMQRGKGVGVGGNLRYFRPITLEANLPNPYNAGTTLARTPWRNTFIDGMFGGYDGETFECYSATLFTGSIRMFYNVDLMREITGHDRPPASFGELCALCAKVRAFADRTGRDVVPIAGSSLSGAIMFDGLFKSQTQRLGSTLNPAMDFPVEAEEFALAYLNRQWSLDQPAMREATELMRTAGQLMPAGFMQAGREQANLFFVQGRALMMMGFSVEAAGVLKQAKFSVRAFRSPEPVRDDPRFGPQLVDRNADNGVGTYGGFGITRSSRHPEQALDFLRFLTCEASCRTYTRISHNLPTLTSVAVLPDLQDFAPDQKGYPPGPSLLYLPDTNALLLRLQHLLFGPEGDVGNFLTAYGRELGPAMRRDLERNNLNRIASVRRIETSIAATRQLLQLSPADPGLALKYQSQVEAQNELEANIYYTRLRLQQAERR